MHLNAPKKCSIGFILGKKAQNFKEILQKIEMFFDNMIHYFNL